MPRPGDPVDLEIDDSGEVQVVSRAAQRRLASAAGGYRLLPSTGDLLLFQRQDDEVRPSRPSGVSLCGEIAGAGTLANVLNFIHFCQFEGTLAVLSGPLRKQLTFRRGQLLSAGSSLPEERVGALLVRFGKIDPVKLDEAQEEVTLERRLGTILVERGLVSAGDLYDVSKRQAEEVFFSTLLIARGSFYFVQGIEEDKLPVRLHLDTQSLLIEGLARIDEMSFFRSLIPSSAVILSRRRPTMPGLPTSEPQGEARLLWQVLDVPRTLADAARLTNLGEFAATKAAFALAQMGYLEVREPSEPVVTADVPQTGLGEALLEAIDAANAALARLLGGGEGRALRQAAQAFVDGHTRFHDLFRGVALAEDGTLSRRQVLLNVDGLPDAERLGMVRRGLADLVHFVEFMANQ
ncbi:MAG TPA: DUF4388 domain-containing protein [Haliangiales bacterium]|nr:DUF4388 domain-containing protein [Haliangiales bacterium]